MSWKNRAKRTARACDQCRRRKAKCDGEPLCHACDALGLECSYGVGVKQLRGPAYVAHLEHKIGELEAKLQSSQSPPTDLRTSRCNEDSAANGIISPPETLSSATGSSPAERENDHQVFVRAANSSLDDSVGNTIFISPDMSALLPPPPPGSSLQTWAAPLIDEQFRTSEPLVTSEMVTPFGLDLYGSHAYSGPSALDHSFMNDLTALEPLPPIPLIKPQHDPEPDLMDFPTSELIEQTEAMSSCSSNNSSKRSAASKDRTELRDRNRIAAAKCRSIKKVAHQKLATDAQTLQSENTRLKGQLLALRAQRSHLQEFALQHDMEPSRRCRCASIHQYNKDELGKVMA